MANDKNDAAVNDNQPGGASGAPTEPDPTTGGPNLQEVEAAKDAETAPDAKTDGNRSAKTKGGVVDAFLKATKTRAEDVMSFNDERQTVVTKQGGKYQNRDGVFFTLGGPILDGTLATTVLTPLQPTNAPALPTRG